MPEVEINKLQIDFPYEPYEIQKEYMQKVVECLQKRENAVLESPTGTGKTLSLLCSSLAWLISHKALFQMRQLTGGGEMSQFMTNVDTQLTSQTGQTSSNSWGAPPKIVYASRTHSQLNQVMLELKKTAYSYVKVGVLGSRDQLCIHPKVSAETNVANKIHMCKTLVANRGCPYYNNVEKNIQDPVFQHDVLVDIEDLVKKGKQRTCCPYYASRELQKNVDILFTPYNYLLDAKTRRAQDIKLFNDVVILDEAHNVERVCEESASAQLTSTVVALCINETTSVMKEFQNETEQSLTEKENSLLKEVNPDDLVLLKTMFMEVEKSIDDITLIQENDKKSKTFDGSHIFNILERSHIKLCSIPALLELLNKICQFLITKNESQVHLPGAGLQKFTEFLEIVLNSVGRERSVRNTDANYKLYVEEEVPKSAKGSSWATTNVAESAKGKILNFWCFNPGFGMRSLHEQGVHSIILTSGTLSPLAATISEIGIPVKFSLSNPHIIKKNQICAVIVEKSPAGTELRCTYQNRSDKKYLSDLGQTCLNFYRVISGGVLVFFPSYPFLKSCVECWQENGIWDKLATIKSIFIEPQSKDALKPIIEEYYKMIEEKNGASLFAVCRGKLSEGLDFADSRARAVIVIGLPYPPFYDPKVLLKRSYLDNGRKTDPSKLDGNEWYNLEALRAVNQAVGRVIRHADDYGVIIFCDCRFAHSNNFKSLSTWLQSHVTINSSFGQSLKLVSTFFKTWKDAPPPVRIAYEGTNVLSSSSHIEPKYRPIQQAQKLANETSNKTDFRQLYHQSANTSVDRKPSVKRNCGGSVLDSLDVEISDAGDQSSIPTNPPVQEPPVAEKQNSETLLSINMFNPSAKKRIKLRVTPMRLDNETKDETKMQIIPFMIKLQKKLRKDQLDTFKKSLSAYGETRNCDTFFATLGALFLSSNDECLNKLVKEIPHFLLNDDHKHEFWTWYEHSKHKYKAEPK